MHDEPWQRRKILLASAGAAMGANVHAPAWPNGKVVKILVGFPPDQATDTVARLLADKLQVATDNTYTVENRPGQGGSLALGQLAKSPADTSVAMLAHMSALATNPHVYKSVPYDALRDFEAVGLVGDLPFMLVCNPSLPVSNVPELIHYAKAHPEKLTNASSGNGTVSHLAMEEFKRKAAVLIGHIPYKGSMPGLTDVVAGNVSMALETAAAVQPFIRAGRLRALAVGTPKRLNSFSDVPTLSELGVPEINAVTWLMLLYPAGTAKAAVMATFDRMNNIIRTPEVVQRLVSRGVMPRLSNNPEEAATYIRSEFKTWGDVVKRSGTVLD